MKIKNRYKYTALLGLALTAAATAYAGGLDIRNMRYYDYKFIHKSLAADKQLVQFKIDGVACEAEAQDAFEGAYKHRKGLSELYGVPLDREALLTVKKGGFIECMCGDSKGRADSKGWVAIRQN